MLSFVESKLFSRLLAEYLTDDDYARLQSALIEAPERGDLVPGSGGVRKLRWAQPGRGKRHQSDLLRQGSRGDHLDAYNLRQERRGEHPCPHSAQN